MTLASDCIFVLDISTDISVQGGEEISNLVLYTLTVYKMGISNFFTGLKTLVVPTIHKVVSSLEITSLFSDGMIEKYIFISLVSVVIKLEQRNTVTNRTKMDNG